MQLGTSGAPGSADVSMRSKAQYIHGTAILPGTALLHAPLRPRSPAQGLHSCHPGIPPSRRVSHGRHWGLRFVAGSCLDNIFYKTSLHTISESYCPEGSTLGSPRALPQASLVSSPRQHGRNFLWAPEQGKVGRGWKAPPLPVSEPPWGTIPLPRREGMSQPLESEPSL